MEKMYNTNLNHADYSTDLMPSILDAFDELKDKNNIITKIDRETNRKNVTTTRLYHQHNKNFTILSPCVQKILSNVTEQHDFSNHHTKQIRPTSKCILKTTDKHFMKSNESLNIISPNVQKMLSNLPDNELVLSPTSNTPLQSDMDKILNDEKEMKHNMDESGNYLHKPLGSFSYTTPQGITSRSPVGREKVGGKTLQVPNETANTNLISDVSRPMSLTSLGSCSSSGSSGPHQTESAYLASAESLDSDHEQSIDFVDSADSGIADQTNQESRVLNEVLDTENVYVNDLGQVVQGYLHYWLNDTDCPLKEHLEVLFNNLESIYEFNRSFLEQLTEAACDPTKTANVFIRNDKGFFVYNEYCANYPRTMDVLSELIRNDKSANALRDRQVALGHALPLGSYLLKPVQRILKYHLFLQRLSKQCDDKHQSAVDLALATMTSIASNINNMKRKHEDAVRVQEIQSQLYGWPGEDLTSLGELIAEGNFRMAGVRSRRHIFLFDKVLIIVKNKQDGTLCYKSHIMCSNLMLVEHVRGEPLSFQVLPFDNPRLACTLRARSSHHKREWTLQIKRVILENYSAVIPNLARELIMKLGQDIIHDDEGISVSWSPLKPQHSTPHYLERRSRKNQQDNTTSNKRRAQSQDRTFTSFGSWRRRSEPGVIPQYDSKTMPKKISQLKKERMEGNSTFYTELSDSENGGDDASSTKTNTDSTPIEYHHRTGSVDDMVENKRENDLEKIVSDLLMQNREFNKILSRRRHQHEQSSNWFDKDRNKMTTKADSLPRSFQLNDQIESNRLADKDRLPEETNGIEEEQQDSEVSLQPDDGDCPIHRIYRSSPIRHSLLQRVHTIITEEKKRNSERYQPHKQGSKSMGAKIAHPNYVDPHKLFTRPDTKVLINKQCDDASQTILDSSQDSFYETRLEENLIEEYVCDETTGKMVAKQDSFRDNFEKNSVIKEKRVPPPIPTKPTHLNGNIKLEKSRRIVTTTTIEKSWVKTMVGRFE